MDVEVELHSYTRSNQVDFHLSFILCTFITHSQVGAEIEVGGENQKDSKEAETQVSTYKCFSCFLGASPSSILPIICSFRFDVSSEKQWHTLPGQLVCEIPEAQNRKGLSAV